MTRSPPAFALAAILGLCAASPLADATPAASAPADASRWRYIVHFDDAPLATWRGSAAGDEARLDALAPTSPEATGASALDVGAPASRDYLAHLARRRTVLLGDIAARIGRPVSPEYTYAIATHGVALSLDAAEAARVAALPGVAEVRPEVMLRLMSDATPAAVRADVAWASGADPTLTEDQRRGAGAVIGVLDAGIRPTHASFAATAGGYTHANPKGQFLGLCDPATPLPTGRAFTRPTCNAKLIGIHDFLPDAIREAEFDAGIDLGRDGTDHGSHVASVAAGNPMEVVLGGAPRPISGVAPRANLISYKVCHRDPAQPSSPGVCPGAAVLAAIDRAIVDGVDVLLLPMGGGRESPYDGVSTAAVYDPRPCTVGGVASACSDAVALLNAREAGIIAAVAAGNEGRSVGGGATAASITSPGNAPWVVTAGMASHDRRLDPSGAYSRAYEWSDILALESGRGPNVPVASMMGALKPDVVAPGHTTYPGGIIAALGTQGDSAVGSRAGTSVAAAATAGGLALLAASRPDWGPSELHSALVGTARPEVRLGPIGVAATTFGTPFQQGAGMIHLPPALMAGLVLPITPADFRAGNPAAPVNGRPRELNLPSLTHEACFRACTLTRRFQALVPGTYVIEPGTLDGLTLTASAPGFTLEAGQVATVDFNVTIGASRRYGAWTHGRVRLRRTDGDGRPDLVLPVSIYAQPGDLPLAVDAGVPAEAGAIDVPVGGMLQQRYLRIGASALVAPQASTFPLAVDPTPGDPWDGTTGVALRTFALPASSVAVRHRVIATLTPPAGMQAALTVGINAPGATPSATNVRCSSSGSDGAERCEVLIDQRGDGQPYQLFVRAQYVRDTAATPARVGQFTLETAHFPLVRTNAPALVATGPGRVGLAQPFNLRLAWNDPTFLPGDVRYGEIVLQAGSAVPSPDDPLILASIPVRLERTGSTKAAHALRGGVPHTLALAPGAAHERIVFDVPPSATAVSFSVASVSEVDLYIARTNPVSGAPAIEGGPARASALRRAEGPGGNHTITLTGVVSPGRYYVMPVNTGASRATATVTATVNTSSTTGPAFRSGQYFNPARNGHGLFVDTTATDFIVLWYTYDQAGAPTWLYGQGRRPANDRERWEADLYRVSWNGTSNSDSVIVGRAAITMRPQAAGQPELLFTFTVDGYTGFEPMIRLDTNGCPAYQGAPLNGSGHWYAPSTPGFGYSVDLEPGVEIIAAYVYDDLGQPRWLLAQEPFNASATSLPLRQFTGFCPSCAATTVSSVPVGTLTRTYAASAGGDGQPGITTMGVNATFAPPLSGTFDTISLSRAVTLLAARQGCTP